MNLAKCKSGGEKLVQTGDETGPNLTGRPYACVLGACQQQKHEERISTKATGPEAKGNKKGTAG